MPASEPIVLTVNGRRAETIADPETPLLYVLRNDLGLKGTKFGCGAGTCGACTVHVDGRPEPSCILPISAVEGRPVTTIESLSVDGPDRLQRAFIETQAGQCGYCLSGILMTARALLDHNPNPTRHEIRSALDAHICRCGVMDRIIRAVERAISGDAS
jgi:nicotinate dehydrogenase subunit A